MLLPQRRVNCERLPELFGSVLRATGTHQRMCNPTACPWACNARQPQTRAFLTRRIGFFLHRFASFLMAA